MNGLATRQKKIDHAGFKHLEVTDRQIFVDAVTMAHTHAVEKVRRSTLE